MKRKLLSIICVISMCFSMVTPVTAVEESQDVSQIDVQEVDELNLVSTSEGKEGWNYDASTSTLTLTDYVGTDVESTVYGTCQIYSEGDLHIVLNGVNSFTGTADYGIYCEGKLTISGNGSLTMSDIAQGIYAQVSVAQESGTVVMNDAGTAIETGSSVRFSGGSFEANGEIVVKMGTAEIKDAELSVKSIYTTQEIIIVSSTVTATLEGANIKITDSTVTSKTNNSDAIEASTVVIENSNVIAHTTSHSLAGIRAEVTITNSTVDVLGSWEGISGNTTLNSGILDIVANGDIGAGVEGTLTVNDGDVTIDSNKDGVSTHLLMNGGKVTITAIRYGVYGLAELNAGEAIIFGESQALKDYSSDREHIFGEGVEISAGTDESTSRYQEAYYGERYLHASSLGNIDKNEKQNVTVFIDGKEISDDYEENGIRYESETNTLTLTDYTFKELNEINGEGSFLIYADGDLKLEIEGENSSDVTVDTGIGCEGNLTISGSGKLKITNTTSGIYAKISMVQKSGNVIVDDKGATISTGTEVRFLGGSYTGTGSVNVRIGSVEIHSSDVTASKIDVTKNILINASNVTAVLDAKDIIINDSIITAEAKDDNAIETDTIDINGSEVIAHTSSFSLSGIYGAVNMTDSTVDAKGSWQGIRGDVTVNSGILKVKAVGDIGVGVEGTLTVNDGEVTIESTRDGVQYHFIMHSGKATITAERYGVYGFAELYSGEVSIYGKQQAIKETSSGNAITYGQNLEMKTGVLKETAKSASAYYGENYIETVGIPVSGVTISETQIQLEQSDRMQLTATIMPESASNQKLEWASSDTDIAWVNDEGIVSANDGGTAFITVATKDGRYTATCKVVVKDRYNKTPFKDVKITDWYYDYVKYVNKNGLMTGTTDTTFAPKDHLTRAQFAMILYRMNGEPAVKYSETFSDVPEGKWYANAVLWASEAGIVLGDNGMFRPNDNITREQMALMMYRYAKQMGFDISEISDLSSFSDILTLHNWAEEAMEWAVGSGIIAGNANGTLNPRGNATRAECATIIMRFTEKYL